jgi:hypothetical protein
MKTSKLKRITLWLAEDGYWLQLCAKDGSEALLNLGAIHGDLTRKIALKWAEENLPDPLNKG